MPVTSIDDLKVAIANIIRKASGVNAVIEANQSQSPPEGLYGTYNITPIRAYGHPRKSRTDIPAEEPGPDPEWEDFSEATISELLIMVSVNFFEPGSMDAAWLLHNASFRQPVREMLYSNGIAWRNVSEIRDLSELYEGSIQARYQADIQMFVEVQITDTVLRAAGFTIEVVDESGNIIIEGGG